MSDFWKDYEPEPTMAAPMTTEKALDLALEALEELNDTNSYWWQEVDEATIKKIDPAITAIKQARSAPVQTVAWRWHQAPVKTSWGHDMVVADLAIDKDNTVSVYCERDQTAKVEAMFPPPAQLAPVQSCYCPNCEAMGKELAALKAQPAPVPEPVADAMARYLRVCSSGGMPKKLQESVQNLVYDAERLGYFKATTTPAQPAPAPGYCKHCKQYSIEEPLPAAQPAPKRRNQMNEINHIKAALLAFGPDEGVTFTHDTWSKLHAAMSAVVAQPAPVQELVAIDGNTSDGHHTFNELYEFRKAYNAALFNEWAAGGKCSVHKSWRHHDNELCFGGGWFIVVAVLPQGQISNHYEAKDWDLFAVPEVKRALFEFDGHTSADVVERLKTYTTPPAAPVVDCHATGVCVQSGLRAVKPAMPWQPIETAPKDFVTVFDGWNGERVTGVSWAHPEFSDKGHFAWCQNQYVANYGWSNEEVRGLTHWMPLPPAPEAAAQRPVAEPHKWVHATEWRGLTDEELRQVWYDDAPVEGGTYIDKLRQVEAKLKEKNQ